jgi:hypothetical protein
MVSRVKIQELTLTKLLSLSGAGKSQMMSFFLLSLNLKSRKLELRD